MHDDKLIATRDGATQTATSAAPTVNGQARGAASNVRGGDLPQPFAEHFAPAAPLSKRGLNGHSNGQSHPEANADMTPLGRALEAIVPAEIGIADCGHLMKAVTSRLRLIVGTPLGEALGAASDVPQIAAAARIRRDVLECAAALDHLREAFGRILLGAPLPNESEMADAQTRPKPMPASMPKPARMRVDAVAARRNGLESRDALTLLPKRVVFRERLEYVLAQSASRPVALAVVVLQIDGFAQVNEAHGHVTGDNLLKVVAARLCRSVHATEMVSRLEGDEFACLLADVMNREELGHRVFRLFSAVAGPSRIGAVEVAVSPSVGVAVCPGDGATAEALLRNAAAARRRAQRHAAGYAFFDHRADL